MIQKIIFCILFIILFLSIFNYTEKNIEQFVDKEKSNNIIHLFWTGGFDSTFRLCQALIDENKIVQPYYLTGKIDDCRSCKLERKNKEFEINTMKKIIDFLREKYPKKIQNLRDIKYINEIKEDKKTTDDF